MYFVSIFENDMRDYSEYRFVSISIVREKFQQKYPKRNHNCVCSTMRVRTKSSLSYSAHESRDKMVSDIKKISYLAMSNAARTAHLGQPWQETSRHRCMCTWVRCAKTLHCAVCRMLSDGRAWNPVKRLRRTSFDAMSLI